MRLQRSEVLSCYARNISQKVSSQTSQNFLPSVRVVYLSSWGPTWGFSLHHIEEGFAEDEGGSNGLKGVGEDDGNRGMQ